MCSTSGRERRNDRRALHPRWHDEPASDRNDLSGRRAAPIAALVAELVREQVTPGLALIVSYRGEQVGAWYTGVADRLQQRPATAATVWSLASLTEVSTAAAALLLVERGLLALDQPLGAIVPEFLDGKRWMNT